MKIIAVSIFSVLALVAAGLFGASAKAFDPFQETCLNSNGQSSICQDSKKPQSASSGNSIYGKDGIISKGITILDIVIGVAAVVMVIIGGFRFVLSGGDSNQVTSARNTILYAIVGIAIAVSGQLVVKFVINRL